MSIPDLSPSPEAERWQLGRRFGLLWDVAHDRRRPHQDELEMSGRGVSVIVTYGVGAQGELVLSRRLVWPTLRTLPNNTHASLRCDYGAEATPVIEINGQPLSPGRPQRITLDGTLRIESNTGQGLQVTRCLFPTTRHRAALERWTLRNDASAPMTITCAPLDLVTLRRGGKGIYVLEVTHDAPEKQVLAPGESFTFSVTFQGRKVREPRVKLAAAPEEVRRRRWVQRVTHALRLETPDPLLNRAFAFAKVRAAESVFDTACGLMHSPGGNEYYAAVWTNDEVEYAGPFFPYLGEAAANEASLNAYRLYFPFMGPGYHALPSSIIAEGVDIWEGAGDRGDAAMYAHGATQFALARGDRPIAEELWPAVVWCLEYCRRQLTPEGVVASDSDELEGRFPAGSANLSTCTLYYGGLRGAARLARALGREARLAEEYEQRAEALAEAIERYFGAEVEGFPTYRYYDGNDVLRAWICLPLTVGIMTRREGTLQALFSSRLWSADGLATQAGDTTFWDRTTLFALRGAFCTGATETALHYLAAYTRRRLLGEHVPYPVEAYPEGNQRHLSAESALYARIYTEGMFGLRPDGFRSFTCTPRLPESWPRMALRSVRAFGSCFDLFVTREGAGGRVTVQVAGRTIHEATLAEGESTQVVLSPES